MILTCFWCERPFGDEGPMPVRLPVYDYSFAEAVWVELCEFCNTNREPTIQQLVRKIKTDPLIYAMEQAIEAK